ncbi:MAG: aldo/keto reductase [Planctomycetia bacterium]
MLRDVGRPHGASPGAVAVAWVLGHPAVTAAIVGARRAGQFADVVAAAALELSPAERGRIEASLTPARA